MKRFLTRILFFTCLFCLCFGASSLYADDPQPPPPPPGEHGASGNKGPMGSPVGGGVAIFMAFAAAYAGWEYYKSRKKEDTV
jgi:UDP-N-acetylmuramyl pentapeptide phosphotransferase/UDP-N-acetylglucosamine-1-phosphate transferase